MRASRQALTAWAFLAPALALFFLFVLVPILAALYLSFTSYDGVNPPIWIGLRNYHRLARDLAQGGLFSRSLANTGRYAAGVIPLGMALALGLALLLNRRLRGVSFYRAAFYLPVVTSLVAVSMVWMWLYEPNSGLLNLLLARLHLPPRQWLADPALAIWCIVAMSVWKVLGYNMVIFLAGLQGIPPEFHEAAAIDGATPWQRFRHITWPLLKPTTFFILVISVIGASQVFAQVYVMTNGGPNNSTTTIVHQIFQNAFAFMKMGYASAMAFLLFLIIFAVSLLNLRLFRGEVSYT
jgi:ABC-type sugar transport system permease subunit